MKRLYTLIIIGFGICMNVSAQPGRYDLHERNGISAHAEVQFGRHERYNQYHDADMHFHYGMYGWHDPEIIDIVHLKNGSQIHGIIIELVPTESLSLVTWDGSRYVFDMNEVEAITKEYGRWSRMYRRALRQSTAGKFHKPRGYFGIAEIGVGAMFLSENIRVGATIINGYRFTPGFALGFGTGFHFYTGGAEYAIPLYLHVRSDFFNRARTPFFALNVGGQIQLTDDVTDIHSGFFIEPSFGYGFNTGENQRCNISLGLALDMYNDDYRYMDAGLCLKFGYSF